MGAVACGAVSPDICYRSKLIPMIGTNLTLNRV